ncbi:hypothetical protein SLUN_11785 [Streptomyces lunaelactis]|uniref:Uncharacterized protein n=1 Tax=Streptomyces lunaelactis TaxID=1535768 RepID=A0A2R4T120_9ACTN|nr:hypothetical protein [Streptomyces lunaelactis]AVZ72767.1 hypothetical protein SLUN_11785 [Streptomyces lunaelactis]NUK87890.1 hypothetical protein [Streptomyces lunaelactis]
MPQIQTAAERLERVRETLEGFQGARAGSRTARRLGLSRGQNLLIGAALHAAARLDRGLKPTELEEQLLQMLRAGADDDAEVGSWGRLFAEQRSARGGVKVFPAPINQLDVNTGYSMEDLLVDLVEVTSEIVAQPNVEIVDVTQTTSGESTDREEFLQALAEYGGGVTVLTTPEERQMRAAVPVLPLRVVLKPSWFRCDRRSTELGKDEIYWAMAAGADSNAKKSFKTPEFGSVVTGSERQFNGQHAFTLADTTVRGHLSLNIECWEADHSSGGFYNKMREVLATMAERLAEGSRSQTYSPPEHGGDNGEGWAALLAIILGLVNLLLGWLTNDDDLVCERSIGLSRYALSGYFTPTGREASWLFDGGKQGRHRLYLHGTVAPVTVPVRYRYVTQAGSWNGEAPIGDQRNVAAPPVGVSYNGNLGILYADAATNELLWTGHGNDAGTGFRGVGTAVPPGVAVHDGKLYCAHLGLDKSLYWNTLTSDGWSSSTEFYGWGTRHSPALAVHNNTLYCAHTGIDGSVYLSAFTGSGWGTAVKFESWGTTSAPALTSHAGQLYCAHRGVDDKIYLASSSNGTSWGGASAVSGWMTYDAPALASFTNKLHLAHRDRNGTLYVGAQNGSTWSATQLQTGGYGAPSLAPHDGQLFALYV